MGLTLSNALSWAASRARELAENLPTSASQAASAAATAPAADKPISPLLAGLAAVGACVLAVYAIRRFAHRGKLLLGAAPGRANRLHVLHVVLLYLFYVAVYSAADQALQAALHRSEAGLLAAVIAQAVLLAGALGVASFTFRMGLSRGLGLSLRHWFWDALRGIVGYLAVFPVCLGLSLGAVHLLKAFHNQDLLREHDMLVALTAVSLPGQLLVVLSAVVLAPLAEEVFFRGLLQSLLRRYQVKPWPAILACSVLFALAHLKYLSSVPAMFALGVALGYNYERSGRLIAPILIHVLFNGVFIVATLTG